MPKLDCLVSIEPGLLIRLRHKLGCCEKSKGIESIGWAVVFDMVDCTASVTHLRSRRQDASKTSSLEYD